MRRLVLPVCLLMSISPAFAGCSGCQETEPVGGGDAVGGADVLDASDAGGETTGGDASAGDSTSATDSSSTDIDGGEVGCGSGVACGDGCCAAGQVCVEEMCRQPCSGTRCGEANKACCTGKEVCIFEGCHTPGKKCQNSFECPDDAYCEKTLGKCLPRSAQDEKCTWRPPVGNFSPERKGSFDGVEVDGRRYDKSITAPTVADIDGDDLPEIAVLLYRGGLNGALIAVINGEDMSTLAHGAVEEVRSNSAGIAVGQLDPSTDALEIVAPRKAGGLVALKYDADKGELVEWWTNDEGALGSISSESAPAIADIDGNGTPEVVMGFSILTADGKIWNGINEGAAGGQRGNNAVTSAVDLTPKGGTTASGSLEIVAGNRVMKADGSLLWDRSDELPEGYAAVGDVGDDGSAEVVLVASGDVWVLNGRNGQTVFGPKAIPGGGEGGPPTIADFDGDDVVEFAAAGQGRYTVYDLDCQGDDPKKSRCASQRSDGILWSKEVQDLSSSRTGSSVFDFEGDGKAEVVYNDECFLRIFDGETGDVLFERANTSRTGSEYPIIVDVDRDFNSEIVVVSNNDQIDRDKCEQNFDNYPDGGTTGVFVYGDADDNWVPTRTIWNEHTYHITNVLEDGSIPKSEPIHYKSSITNSFRLNVQPDGLFNAPDLVVTEVAAEEKSCNPGPTVVVEATVENQGALGVGPGQTVAVGATVDGSTVDIGTVQTTKRLLPGQSETVSISWTLPKEARQSTFEVSGSVDPDDELNECNSDNNTETAEVDGERLQFSSLKPTSLTVSDSDCGRAGWKVDFEVTVENEGGTPVPAGVPIEIRGSKGGQSSTLATVQTSTPLTSGETETVGGTWTTPKQLQNEAYDVTAHVDPDSEVSACGGSSDMPTDVLCLIGG